MGSKFVIVVSAACVLSSCSGHSWGPSGQPVEHFIGHMSATETGNWFVACGAANSQTPIRVTVTDDAVVEIADAEVEPGGRDVDRLERGVEAERMRRAGSLHYVGTQRRVEGGVPRLREWIPGDGVGSAAVIDVGGGGAV